MSSSRGRVRGITPQERVHLEERIAAKTMSARAKRTAVLNSSQVVLGTDSASPAGSARGRRRTKGMTREEVDALSEKMALKSVEDVRQRTYDQTWDGPGGRSAGPRQVSSGRRRNASDDGGTWTPFDDGTTDAAEPRLSQTQRETLRVVEAAGLKKPTGLPLRDEAPVSPEEVRRRTYQQQYSVLTMSDVPAPEPLAEPPRPLLTSTGPRGHSPTLVVPEDAEPRTRKLAQQVSTWSLSGDAPERRVVAAAAPVVSSVTHAPPERAAERHDAPPQSARARMHRQMAASSWTETLGYKSSPTSAVPPSGRGLAPPATPEVSARARMQSAMAGTFRLG